MNSDDKAKILVVDDLPENRLSYQAILEELQQEIVLVGSGEEALKEILKNEFAVILLDVNMPGLDGLETGALIRSRKRSAHTPIIFVTAFADDLRISEGYALGAVDYIASPVVPEILRAKVRVFVDLFRLNAQIRRHADEQVVVAQERVTREMTEEANRRLSFLARAGAIITKSLDRQITIDSILRLMVPEHAADAVLAEQDEGGKWKHVRTRRQASSLELETTDGIGALPGAWRDAIEQALTTGQTQHRFSEASGDNGSSPLSLVAIPVRDRSRVFSALLLVRDTAYSAADVVMFESFAWRAGIAVVNASLYQEIERADQQKDRFLSMLAHELRNPLAPIRSAVDVLQLCGDSPADIEWAREVIDRQVNHMVRLVDDLLDVSRITLGKIRLQPEVVNANDLITAAVEICRPLIEKNEHELTISLSEEPVPMYADRARLVQVLANLLNNAAKFTSPRGTICTTVERVGDDVVFRVRDTGIGIPKDMLERVFEMFIQADNGLERAHGGLGVGLTLVRELVEMHQGSISVASEGLGRGSEFTVRIPCNKALLHPMDVADRRPQEPILDSP